MAASLKHWRFVLASLNINSSWLEGSSPPSLVSCQHLEVLNVGNNQFDDTFPHLLDSLTKSQVLILHSNCIWGSIAHTEIKVPFS